MNSWARVPVGTIADLVDYGVTASATDATPGPKFLRITDIQDNRVNWTTVPSCECSPRELNESRLCPGDIVFARTGATTGKSFLIRQCPEGAVFASYLIRVRLKAEADPLYVSHFFKSDDYWAQINRGARGVAQPGVNASTLRALEVPLPPLAEQRRIAAILDQADALRAKRREALEQLQQLQQAIFMEMFGDPARNTHNLPVITLGEAGKWQSGGTPPRKESKYFVGPIPWFSSGELGPLYVSKSHEHISPSALSETATRPVPKGAFLLGMYDTAALKASIADVDCSCNQAIAFSLLNPCVLDTVYAYHAVVIGREHFRRMQRGVRQKNLNLEMIRQIAVPYPPLKTQHVFSKRMENLAELSRKVSESMVALNFLFSSLQHRAFCGEL